MLAADSPASPVSRPRRGSGNDEKNGSNGNLDHLLQYGTAVSRYTFRRVTRTGPRLLLYLAAAVTALLVVTGLVAQGERRATSSSSSSLTTSWLARLLAALVEGPAARSSRLSPEDANARDGVVGGGLRVVVFGENDVATSRLHNVTVDGAAVAANNGTSWTEELCFELACTSYHSFVPALELPRRSLSSNALYADAVDDVRAAAAGALPANDFSWVAQAYPVPTPAPPDLRAQVDAFLQQPPPQRPPKDTVFVFSFGQWDVWSLAAFPSKTAEHVVTDMVGELVEAVDAVFQAAHGTDSVAYSDPGATPLRESGDDGGGGEDDVPPAALPIAWNDTAVAAFRVVVPLLLDPSVLPGWRLARPAAPPLHTAPEQVRRAVRLTQLWNDRVAGELAAWAAKQVNDSAVQPDATVFPLADYVVDVLIDGQMKTAGLTDRKSFGKLPKAEAFAQVQTPCLAVGAGAGTAGAGASATAATAAAATTTSTALPFTIEMNGEPKGRPNKVPKKGSAPAGSVLPAVCASPDRHLFFTPFSLGRRAIASIGRQAAAFVQAESSVRQAWMTLRRKAGSDRTPASWKEYEL